MNMVGKINKVVFENFMLEHKLSIEQFCAMCGIGVVKFNRIINTENKDIVSLIKISHITNIPLDEMFKR